LKESQGVAISVQDEEIVAAQKQLAQTEGIFTSPEGAATLAATKRLVANGWLQPNQKVVLLNTGGGLKYI
jgi:threonine synthase